MTCRVLFSLQRGCQPHDVYGLWLARRSAEWMRSGARLNLIRSELFAVRTGLKDMEGDRRSISGFVRCFILAVWGRQ